MRLLIPPVAGSYGEGRANRAGEAGHMLDRLEQLQLQHVRSFSIMDSRPIGSHAVQLWKISRSINESTYRCDDDTVTRTHTALVLGWGRIFLAGKGFIHRRQKVVCRYLDLIEEFNLSMEIPVEISRTICVGRGCTTLRDLRSLPVLDIDLKRCRRPSI
jgi:hypothetical protein